MRARRYVAAAVLCLGAGASWCGSARAPVPDARTATGATFLGLGVALLAAGTRRDAAA